MSLSLLWLFMRSKGTTAGLAGPLLERWAEAAYLTAKSLPSLVNFTQLL